MAPTFGPAALVVEEFPADKDALELAWAWRFTDALEKQKGVRYEVVGSISDPPGDVLLRRESQPDIFLEVTEATDQQRIESERFRKLYVRAISDADPRLKTAFSGIQIAMIDGGQMLKLPNPQSQVGAAVAAALSKFILGLEPRLSLLPVCPTGGSPHPRGAVFFRDPVSEVSVSVFLTRYAPIGAAAAAQWQWSGPAWSIGDVAPHYFLEAIKSKLDKNFAKIRNPLWLLVYTVDCPYDSDQEAEIQSCLATTRNPFDCIYILDRARTRQVFPLVDDPTTAPGKKGFTILGSDLIPAVNDPRYRDIE